MAKDSPPQGDNSEKRRKDRMTLPRKQVLGELHLEATGQKLQVEVYLNDLSPSGVGILIETALEPGCAIVLQINKPQRFDVKGEVVWCSQFSVHSVASDDQKDTFAFKAGIRFTPPQPDLLQKLKSYWDKQTKRREE